MTLDQQSMRQDPRRRVYAFARTGFYVDGRPKPVEAGEVTQLAIAQARELEHGAKIVPFWHGQAPTDEELAGPRAELKKQAESREAARKANAAGGVASDALADAVRKAQDAASQAQRAAESAQQVLTQVQQLVSQLQSQASSKGGKQGSG